MSHLFLFTIGPVQSFIAQARKTRDLKAGSDILSELIREAIAYCHDQWNASNHFPPLENRIMAQSPTPCPIAFWAKVEVEQEQAHKMGAQVESAVREAFEKKAIEAIKDSVALGNEAFKGPISFPNKRSSGDILAL